MMGEAVSTGLPRMRALVVGLCLVVLAALLPVTALAASDGRTRNFIVTLAVPDADKTFSPQSRTARQRIRLRAERTEDVTDRLADQHGFRPRHRFERAAPGFSARLTSTQAADIARDQKVATVRPARRFKIAATQVVPSGIARIKAEPEGPPGPDVDVDIAILDTGIGPVGGNELNVMGGYNCTGPVGTAQHDPDDWQDSNSGRHGTHVAGTAAARDNGIGVVGVAPGARLWSVRVIDDVFGDEATVACGIEWAISTHGPNPPPNTQPIDVINMSLQGPRGPIKEQCPGAAGDIIHQAICEAVAAGITVVVAAGNNGSNARRTSPAGYDQVITVGALSDFDGLGGGTSKAGCAYQDEKDDTYARYSNYGKDIDIVAPGTCIRSTTTGDGTATKVLTGTSMASPHVAGAVALLSRRSPRHVA